MVYIYIRVESSGLNRWPATLLFVLLSAFGIALLLSKAARARAALDLREGLWRDTPWVKVHPTTTHFVDSLDRMRIFHGLNVFFKQPPVVPSTEEWDVETSFSAQDAVDLRRWGFNLIRLGVLWQGTFPTSGAQHDPGYNAAIQKIVQLCEAEGIYVVLGMHSDVLNLRFCGNGMGEGMPDSAVDDALPLPPRLPLLPVVRRRVALPGGLTSPHLPYHPLPSPYLPLQVRRRVALPRGLSAPRAAPRPRRPRHRLHLAHDCCGARRPPPLLASRRPSARPPHPRHAPLPRGAPYTPLQSPYNPRTIPYTPLTTPPSPSHPLPTPSHPSGARVAAGRRAYVCCSRYHPSLKFNNIHYLDGRGSPLGKGQAVEMTNETAPYPGRVQVQQGL